MFNKVHFANFVGVLFDHRTKQLAHRHDIISDVKSNNLIPLEFNHLENELGSRLRRHRDGVMQGEDSKPDFDGRSFEFDDDRKRGITF